MSATYRFSVASRAALGLLLREDSILALEDLVAKEKAAAWDEGYGSDLTCNEPRDNPYRRSP